MDVDNNLSKTDLFERASRPLSSLPRPFLRWAGSKRLILSEIVKYMPTRFGTYYEPFLGAGSLFFLFCPKIAVLSDTCKDLIDTFCAVRDGVLDVLTHIEPLIPDRETFYKIRRNRSIEPFKRAAEFIYLNKTCWNGLYRVNSDGLFNVPFGWPKGDVVLDPKNLLYCSNALRKKHVKVETSDFEAVANNAEKGDLVYLDPPYVTGHSNNGFRDYNKKLFSWDDQERLAALARKLALRHVNVIVSNAFHPDIINLYDGFKMHILQRKSTIASDITKRGRVCEALFVSE